MILERVESEHIETAEEIVFTIFVLVRILFVFTKMETWGLQRSEKVCFCLGFYIL